MHPTRHLSMGRPLDLSFVVLSPGFAFLFGLDHWLGAGPSVYLVMASPSLLRSLQLYVFVLNVFLLGVCFSGVFDFYNFSGVGLSVNSFCVRPVLYLHKDNQFNWVLLGIAQWFFQVSNYDFWSWSYISQLKTDKTYPKLNYETQTLPKKWFFHDRWCFCLGSNYAVVKICKMPHFSTLQISFGTSTKCCV